MGLRVFLSYAHDDTAALADRLFADLRAAGHDPWIDREKIAFNDDWREAIIAGLHATDLVLAILSPKAVREHGVCLDEIAIALRVKHGAIATVLAAPEADTRVPASIGHLQWLDMHDWAAHLGTAGWDAWYAPRLQAILALLADPARHAFTGEISELVTRLKPVIQTADLAPKIEGFVGREWLLAFVNDWRLHQTRRAFWLTGAPGTGKSAFAAWMTHFARANVIGLNLCRFGDEDRTDARKIIRSLAFLIAARLPGYRHALLAMLRAHDPDGTETAAKGAPALFSFLLAEPLARAGIDGGARTDRFLLVIDALDETVQRGESVLAQVLAEGAPRLPSRMALLVTSRPEFPAAVHFAGTPPLRLDAGAEAAAQEEDIRVYAQGWLGDATAAAVVAAKADGNFLYLRKLREAVEDHGFPLNPPAGLPQGLQALYYAFFRRQFPTDADFEPFVPLMEVLVAAEHPVPLSTLRELFPAWEDLRVEARMLEGLGSLFVERHAALAPFHSSLRDFLTDRTLAGKSFVVTALFGRRRLVQALWVRFLALPPAVAPDEFLLAELPAQVRALAARTDEATLRALLAQAGSLDALAPRLAATAETQRAARAWDRAEAWFAMLAALGGLAGQAGLGWGYWALVMQGDVLLVQGRTSSALAAFRAAATTARQQAEAEPDNPVLQREVSVSHDRLGDVLGMQGDLPGALAAFRAGMEIRRRLAEGDPANAQAQRDLSISHERLGDVLATQGDLPGALAAFGADMAISRRLAGADPANAQAQRDLSISHDRLGDVLVTQGDLPGALAAFRAGMAISRRLAEADPGNAQAQRDLSVSHNKLADVLVMQGDLPGALAAFRAGMEIRRRLAEADPGNAQAQRDLSISHNNLGDVLVIQGDLPGALAAFRAGMEIRRRLAEADPANAQAQRDLSISQNKLGDVLATQGDLPGALATFRPGMEIRRRLAEADPANAQAQRDLSISHDRLGDVLVMQGDLPGALAAFRAGMAIRRRLAEADPGNAQAQRDLSISHNRLGDVLVRQGDLPGALAAFGADMAISRRLAGADPANAEAQRDLSISHDRLGDVLATQGDLPGALAAFRAGMAISRRLAEADPGNAQAQRDLSVSHNKLGDVLVRQGDLPGALAAFRAGMEIRRRLAGADPGNAQAQRDLSVSLGRVADTLLKLGEGAEARATAARALAQCRDAVTRFPGDPTFSRDLPYFEDLLRRAGGTL